MSSRFDLARQLQATCAVLRSYLGPHKPLKCVIDPGSDARSCLAGTAQAFLLAVDGDPTATTLLLEALEGQAPSASDAPAAGTASGPGSGATWLAAFCGLLLQHMLELAAGQGVPYECVRMGVLQAVGECCKAVRDCTLELPAVAERWDEQELLSYCQAVSALMVGGADAAAELPPRAVATTNLSVPVLGTSSLPTAAAPVAAVSGALTAAAAASVAGGVLTAAPGSRPWTSCDIEPLCPNSTPETSVPAADVEATAAPTLTLSLGAGPRHAVLGLQSAGGGATAKGGMRNSEGLAGGGGDWQGGLATDGIRGRGGEEDDDAFGWLVGMKASTAAVPATAAAAIEDEAAAVSAVPGRANPVAPHAASDGHRHSTADGTRPAAAAHAVWGGVAVLPCSSAVLPRSTASNISSRSGIRSGCNDAVAGDWAGSGFDAVAALAAEDAALAALEEEAAWFFGEGELAAEREARAQGRALQRLAAGRAAAAGATGSSSWSSSSSPVPRGQGEQDRRNGAAAGLQPAVYTAGPSTAAAGSVAARQMAIAGSGSGPGGSGSGGGVPRGPGVRVDEGNSEFGWFEEVVLEPPELGATAAVKGAQQQRPSLSVQSSGPATHDAEQPHTRTTLRRANRVVGAGSGDGGGGGEGRVDDDDDDDFGWFDSYECGGGKGGTMDATPSALSAAVPSEPQQQQQQQWGPRYHVAPCGARATAGARLWPREPKEDMAPAAAEDAALAALEEEAAWFFGEGELAVEREARAQGRALQRLAAGLAAAGEEDRTGAVHTAAAVLAVMPPSPPPAPAPLPPAPLPYAASRGSAAAERGNGSSSGEAVAAAAVLGRGSGGSGAATAAAGIRHIRDRQLSRLVCAAALGLSHGRHLEMRLAAAAALLLLQPLVQQPQLLPPGGNPRSEKNPAEDEEDLRAMAERVQRAAAAMSYERCVLTTELMGRSTAAAAAMRGVVVPLASLTPFQASVAETFFGEMAAPALPPPAAALGTLCAVFFHGALQPDHTAYGTRVVVDAVGLAAAGADARAEAFAARLLAALRRAVGNGAAAAPTPPLPRQRLLFLASGHLPDGVAAALHQLSGGDVLGLGGAGLRAVRAAAACCGVAPTASMAFLDGRRHVAPRVAAELIQGGLGLGDYRTAGARRHTEATIMLRLLPAPLPEATAPPAQARRPGWVTVFLAHQLANQLEIQAAFFRTCFGRLLAALRRGVVLPGAGAWELAVAEHLTRRAEQLELQLLQPRPGKPPLLQPPPSVLPPASTPARLSPSVAAVETGQTALAAAAMDAKFQGIRPGREQGAAEDEYRDEDEDDDQEEWDRDGQVAFFLPLSYKAVAAALRGLVGVLLQNGGTEYGTALAVTSACAQALREGDATRLRRLAAATRTAAAEPPPADEQRQLAEALRVMLGLKDTAAAAEAEAWAPVLEARSWLVRAAAPPPLVLDEVDAREGGLRGACQLALLACAVDRVIVNR